MSYLTAIALGAPVAASMIWVGIVLYLNMSLQRICTEATRLR